jgi:hypothetical protein
MILILYVNFLYYFTHAIPIPGTAVYVGNGGTDSDTCGNDVESRCLTLGRGYTQSGGGDKHVQIYQEVGFSGTLQLTGGGVYYTYGNLKSKVRGTDNMHIDGQSDTSWCV